jgi:hypothetical protein
MSMTSVQLEDLVEHQLREAGLFQFLSREHSQYLDLGDGLLFVEVVLTDATPLIDVEKIVRRTSDQVTAQGGRLDSVVRALWKVEEVRYIGPSRSPNGGLRAAYAFEVALRSGDKRHPVIVDVSWSAVEFLRSKLGLGKFVSGSQNALQKGHITGELLGERVRSFIEHELSLGGTSYWDPIRYPQRDLNDAAMLFLVGQSTAFYELWQAVTDAFEPPLVESFLESLGSAGVAVRDFRTVLPEFSNMLGGAFRPGSKFSPSATDLFERMDPAEQEMLKKYFFARVERLKSESQELVDKFPQIFS